ncbi:MAG: TatD family hydrolase [Candidatus Micrarchaeota archaeon]|nr:TatD family hydrolase [Candidatus Micrarchaeota archaeon]
MLIDAHCHLESIKDYVPSPGFLPITVGYSNGANLKNILIAEKLKIPLVLGIAPQTALKEGTEKLEEWIEVIKQSKVKPVAIGEVGLDYHWAKNEEDKKKEKLVFERMIELAEETHLPIVIHSRKSDDDCIRMLKERKFSNGIMMHFFAGDEKQASNAIDIGSYISIPPVRSKERKKVINSIGLEYMLVETDAPAVVRLPEEVTKSVEYICELKKLEFDVVALQTTKNAIKLFKLSSYL